MKYRFLSENTLVGKRNRRHQPVLCLGCGKIVAADVNFGVFQSPGFYNTYQYLDARSEKASITIGKGTWINNNAMICADKTSIVIGESCLIGLNFICVDSDFHSLDPLKRMSSDYNCEDVHIGNNVFIGSNVTILKGVSVGNNSVIGVGSVVVKSIPENVIAAGSPARIIRAIT